MSRRVIKLLKEYRNSPEFGALTSEHRESLRRIHDRLMTQIAPEANPNPRFTALDFLRVIFSNLQLGTILKPIGAMGALAFAALVSIGSVSAAFDSIPGDALYSLKIASEKAQLTLASTEDAKTRLHIEFANRRAEEINRIIQTSSPEDPRMKKAVGNLKQELRTVSNRLSALKDVKKEDAVSLAKLADRKVGNVELEEVKGEVTMASVQALTVLAEQQDGTAAETLEKKVSERIAVAASGLTAATEKLEKLMAEIAARNKLLAILSEADAKAVTTLKEIRKELAEAKATSALAEESFAVKEFTKTVEQAERVIEAATKAQQQLAILAPAAKAESETPQPEAKSEVGSQELEEAPK